jgi:hypothetical protein
MTSFLQKKTAEYLTEHPTHNRFFAMFDLSEVERAFHGSSFRCEHRAIMVAADFAQRCEAFKTNITKQVEMSVNRGVKVANNGDVKPLIETWCNNFEREILTMFKNYVERESRCMSSMVVGPARFPTEKNRKKLDAAQNSYEEINTKVETMTKRAIRDLLPEGDGIVIKSDCETALEQLTNKIAAEKATQERMKKANALVRRCYPKGIAKKDLTQNDIDALINSLVSELNFSESDAKALITPCRMTQRVIAFASYTLSNHNQGIKRLEMRLKEQKILDEQRNDDDFDGELENGISYHLTSDNKIAIDFGYKPDDATREVLKRNSFKFSRPRGNLWIRKHTLNALAAFKRNVIPVLEELEPQS